MRNSVEIITELPLATILGSEFDRAENQTWLAAWAKRWMALAPTAAYGWCAHGTDLIDGCFLWDEATGDWLEIDVYLERSPKGTIRDSRTPDPVWTLSMDLMVACWCQDNHNAHYVEQHRWDVGAVDALFERADAAHSVAERWITTSLDADHWRRQAGLQLRSGSTNLG